MIDLSNLLSPVISAASLFKDFLDKRNDVLATRCVFCDTYQSASHLCIRFIATKPIQIKQIGIKDHYVSSFIDSRCHMEMPVSIYLTPGQDYSFQFFVSPPLTGSSPIFLSVDAGSFLRRTFGLRPIDFDQQAQCTEWPAPLTDRNGEVLAEPLDIIEEFEDLNMQFPPSKLRP